MSETIVKDEDILNGRPRLNGTKISVETIVRLLLSNSREEITELYNLSKHELEAVVKYAEENRPRIANALSRQQHLARVSRKINQELICECGTKWNSMQEFSVHFEHTGCNIKRAIEQKQICCTCGETCSSKTEFFAHILQTKTPTNHFPQNVSIDESD